MSKGIVYKGIDGLLEQIWENSIQIIKEKLKSKKTGVLWRHTNVYVTSVYIRDARARNRVLGAKVDKGESAYVCAGMMRLDAARCGAQARRVQSFRATRW